MSDCSRPAPLSSADDAAVPARSPAGEGPAARPSAKSRHNQWTRV